MLEQCYVNCLTHGQQFGKFPAAFYTGISTRLRLWSNRNPMIRSKHLDSDLRVLAQIEVDNMWPEIILWTDEARFRMEVAVNMQKYHLWGLAKLCVVHEQPLHSVYVALWCGFTTIFILVHFSLR